eukprot:995690-Amphidinium_carterae.1
MLQPVPTHPLRVAALAVDKAFTSLFIQHGRVTVQGECKHLRVWVFLAPYDAYQISLQPRHVEDFQDFNTDVEKRFPHKVTTKV